MTTRQSISRFLWFNPDLHVLVEVRVESGDACIRRGSAIDLRVFHRGVCQTRSVTKDGGRGGLPPAEEIRPSVSLAIMMMLGVAAGRFVVVSQKVA